MMPLLLAGATVVAGMLGCVSCDSTSTDDSNAYKIGLLLPYTGSSSGTSANFERSVIFAVDRVNAAGGVRGRRLRLIAEDTHSNLARSATSAQRLIDQGVVVVIGPESSDVAAELAPILLAHHVAFLSPMVGAADDSQVTCGDRWFRLAPSARSLGEALGKQLAADRTATTAILHEAGGYNDSFRDAVQTKFTTLGGKVSLSLELDPNSQSYDKIIQRVLSAGVESVVLATSPRTGALVVNEFNASTTAPPKWYLSPLLKTDLFVQNVAPSALDGAKGVAPKIYETGDAFPDAFRSRWEGDLPLEGAYFYYDAVALVAYALQIAAESDAGQVDPAAFKQAVLRASVGGVQTSWNELELALASLREGQRVYYSGLTGPMLLDTCGARKLGAYSVWTVQSGRIVDADNL